MKLRIYLALLLTALIAGCGGSDHSYSSDGTRSPSMLASTKVAAPAADYATVVQQLYVAYFGRPADPAGLANFEAQLSAAGAPTTIQGLTSAYNTNATVKTLIDSFGTSAESSALYTGGTTQFVTAVFTNVLNRAPQSAGLNFWTDAINSGALSRGNAALSIMAGALGNTTAQGLIDAALVNNKIAVGTRFTASVTTTDQINAYRGQTAAATVRAMLATVTDTTDTTAFQTTIDSTVAALVTAAGSSTPTFAQVQSIVMQRCTTCHSANPTQPGTNTAPDGVMFDTEAQIRARAAMINQLAVVQKTMPFGNATGMTEAERTLIGKWFTAGMP